MQEMIPLDWQTALSDEFTKPYFVALTDAVQSAYRTETVYPPQSQLFAALHHTPLQSVRVVIIGQDPYHSVHQAHGLAFSVPDGITTPPSLKNIHREIRDDIGTISNQTGNLLPWAVQGVLLLNSTLTVRSDEAGSHSNFGWAQFTDRIIKVVSDTHDHVVFMLWGNAAQAKRPLIDDSHHLILTAPHPSPLSAYRGFFGCKHFSRCNNYLTTHHKKTITW
jgi:uracil-DNA glycosylase